MKLYNIVKVYTSTVGTGTVTLGSAVPSFITFATAGVVTGSTVSYAIEDGNNREVGTGTYTSGAETLTRSVVTSTNSNNLITLSGNAVVFITGLAADLSSDTANVASTLVQRDGSGNFAAGAATLNSAVVPLIIGGTGTTSTLTLRSTSGVGTTGADIVFQTGNNGATEVMRLQNSGNVGIGTSSPGAPLQVQSSTTAGAPALIIAGESNAERFQIRSSGASGGTPVALLASSRGTQISPTATQSGDLLGYYQFGGYNGTSYFRSAWIYALAAENYTATANGSHILFSTTANGSTSPAERMRIDSSGNVGIGMSGPNTKLEVAGTIRSSSSGATEIQLVTSSATNTTAHILGSLSSSGFDFANLIISSNTTRFNISGSEKVRIDSSGRLQINSSVDVTVIANGGLPATAKLSTSSSDISMVSWGSANSFNQRFARGTEGSPTSVDADDRLGAFLFGGYHSTIGNWNNPCLIAAYVDGSTSTVSTAIPGRISFWTTAINGSRTEKMRIDSSGNVGIGTTPSYRLHVYSDTDAVTSYVHLAKNNGGSADGVYILDDRGFTGVNSGNSFRVLTRNDGGNDTGAVASFEVLGSTLMKIKIDGRIGFGTSSPTYNYHFTSADSSTGANNSFGSNFTINNYNDLTVNPASNPAGSRSYYGTYDVVSCTTGGANVNIYGGRSYAAFSGNTAIALASGHTGLVNNAGTATITSSYGVIGQVYLTNTGNITNSYSILSGAPIQTSTGTITNAYGVYIANQSVGTNRWDLYVESGGNSYIGGNVGIGTPSPGEKLVVVGNIVAGNTGTTADSYIDIDGGATGKVRISRTGTGATASGMVFYTQFSTLQERMRILSTGEVGIGTSSTGFNSAGLPLVIGSGSGNTGMTIYSGSSSFGSLHFADTVTTGGGSYSGYINYSHNTNSMQFGTNATEAMRIDSAGKVGINKAPFIATLDVAGQSSMTALWVTGASSAGLVIDYLGASDNYYDASNHTFRGTSGGATTKVGIGAVPAYPLDVRAATGQINVQSSTGTNYSRLLVQNTGGSFQIGIDSSTGSAYGTGGYSRVIWSDSAYPLVLTTNGTERMRIDSSGKVGIGATTVDALFHVSSGVTTSTNLARIYAGSLASGNAVDMYIGKAASSNQSGTFGFHYNSTSTSSYAYMGIYGDTSTTGITVTPGGKVGIGKQQSTYQLELSTDSAAKPTTDHWTIASDSRLKIVKGEYRKGLAEICQVRPVSYEYNGKGGFVPDGKDKVSILAQELMQVFPECVDTFKGKLEEDGPEIDLYNYNGHAITFALINAIKELKAEIDILKARN